MPSDSSPVADTATAPRREEGHIRTGFDRIIDKSANVVSWLVFIAMVISVIEVVSRYVFDSPTSWVHEMVIFMIAILFALGGSVALARDRHIRVRIIYGAVSPKWRRRLDIFNGVLTICFTFGMSYAAYVMFYRSVADPLGGWTLERSGTSWNPPFPSFTKAVILFALLLMAVQSILHLVHAIRTRPEDGQTSSSGEGR